MGEPDTDDLLSGSVHLQKKQADVLGVEEKCRVRELFSETLVTWHNQNGGDPVIVRLVGPHYTDPGVERTVSEYIQRLGRDVTAKTTTAVHGKSSRADWVRRS